MQNPLKLEKSLENRKAQHAFRQLSMKQDLIDFSSNDYLGLAASEEIFDNTHKILKDYLSKKNGSTGSRLLNGNSRLYNDTEESVATFHKAEAALIFNSGYDANLGFFSCVPQRGDLIFYDELVHASIRDGIKMANSKAFKFLHNDLEDLREKIKRNTVKTSINDQAIYIVTESVFSMDGDIPNLKELVEFADENNYFLVVDEAHAVGVFGNRGEGLLQQLKIEKKVFARIVTFGKALGVHGAAILGSNELKDYLINFSRSFIYTTALPPHSVGAIFAVYQYLSHIGEITLEIIKLHKNISFFKTEALNYKLELDLIPGDSAIQCLEVPGNDNVKAMAVFLQEKGFDVKAILSPTVQKGTERLRICLHSFNSEIEIAGLLKQMCSLK
jgi:8-amino-7-oxononanoate synthase